MNDFENKLRSLRPGTLPDSLQTRLKAPPEAPTAPAADPSLFKVVNFRRFMPAAAAAVAVVVIGYGISKVRQPTVLDHPSGAAPAIAFASEKQHLVTGVRPVATFRDAAKRPWRLMEVTWTEQDTLVSTSVPTLVRVEENRSALVPVAVRFD